MDIKRDQGVAAVCAAVRRLSRHPTPAQLADGLSPAMASHCLHLACDAISRPALQRAVSVPGRGPTRAGVVAARGVFTAPLEWVCLLATVGSELWLKVPAAAPAFGEALAAAFQAEGLPVSCISTRELPDADALVAMGSDETISALAGRYARARLSLHGHRFSVALVQGSDEELARQLALDALLYDGRGCFTPVAVLHLGGEQAARALATRISSAMGALQAELPPGPRDPLQGPEWRRRTGLARALGSLETTGGAASACLEARFFEAAALPGFLPVHPIRDLDEGRHLLRPWRAWLAACASDLDDADALQALDFERLCRPGQLQSPPLCRTHGGMEMLRPLMAQDCGDPPSATGC